MLSNLIKSERFPHSLLFYGTEGIGKLLTAKSIARYFNCQNPDPGLRGDDNCSVCKRIDSGTYPDFFIIRSEKSINKAGKEIDSKVIKIGQIRGILKQIQFKPFEGMNKFFIIDEAETMNVESENAFLKTLEEPLPNNYIILIVHNVNKLLPTIFSRCVKVPFDPIPLETIKLIIKKRYDLNDELSEKISFLSAGSMHNVGILMEDNKYLEIFELLDKVIQNIMEEKMNIEELFSISESISKTGMDTLDYLLDLLLLYVNESYLLSVHNIETKRFFKYYLNFKTKNVKLSDIVRYNSIVNDIIMSKYNLTDTNVDKKLLFENLLVKIRENII